MVFAWLFLKMVTEFNKSLLPPDSKGQVKKVTNKKATPFKKQHCLNSINEPGVTAQRVQ